MGKTMFAERIDTVEHFVVDMENLYQLHQNAIRFIPGFHCGPARFTRNHENTENLAGSYRYDR